MNSPLERMSGESREPLHSDRLPTTDCHWPTFALGRVDKMDSQAGFIVIQDSFWRVGYLGAKSDVGCGMGFLQAIYTVGPATKRA